MTKQEPNLFGAVPEPKDADPIEIAMFHVKRARYNAERGQWVRATAHGSIATATALIAWCLGDPSMTPTIPCTPSAIQDELEHHGDTTGRERAGVPVIEADSQEEAWSRLRR
jgi:hypothetical protein